ncbi:hypothetical protein X943_003907 [Babesia divergens]|uniref:Uncharacterized protein n=1 Tax=Babesia divergens TaxID=32595 RepID=A0AAD9G7Y9_BABDI|nr:hypothetical protein X943_003907 [Babesia divergens]
MGATYNFGQVIDSYIANVFPYTRPTVVQEDEAEASNQRECAKRSFGRDSLFQCIELVVIIAVLILLSTYVLHVRSAYTASTTLGTALKKPIACMESGFQRVLDTFDDIHSKPKAEISEFQHEGVTYKAIELDLKDNHVIRYSDIRSKNDVAFWLQFGLIPAIFSGLNSYNKLVGSTVRFSFVRSNYNKLTYNVDKATLTPNVAIQHQLMSALFPLEVADDDDAADDPEQDLTSGDIEGDGVDVVHVKPSTAKIELGDASQRKDIKAKGGMEMLEVKLPYAEDGKYHTFSAQGGNFYYVTGDSIDAALMSLSIGTRYSKSPPYFPLAAVITDETTTSVALEAFLSNAQNSTISYVNVTFTFSKGQGDTGQYLVKAAKAYSIANNRGGQGGMMYNLIYMFLLMVTIGHFVHSYYMHRGEKVYSLKIVHIIDISSKFLLALCILIYGGRMFWSHSNLPHIHTVKYENGSYDAVVGVSKNGRIIDPDVLQTVFNSLRKNIMRGYWSVGFFHVVTFGAIALLFILLCIKLCSGRNVGVMLRYFAFHSRLQFMFAIGSIVLALCVVSLSNAYIVNFIHSSDASFRYNFATLANILSGVLNKQVEAYLRNYNVLHSLSIVILFILFSYSGIFVLITMMFTINPESNIESFKSKNPTDPYDKSRFINLKKSWYYFVRHIIPEYNVAFLRHFAFSRGKHDMPVSHIGTAQVGNIAPSPNQTGQPNISPYGKGIADVIPQASRSAGHPPPQAKKDCSITVKPCFKGKTVPIKNRRVLPMESLDALKQNRSYYTWRIVSYSLLTIGFLIFAFKEHRYHSVRKLLQNTLNDQLVTNMERLAFNFKEFTTEDAVVKAKVGPSSQGAAEQTVAKTPQPPPAEANKLSQSAMSSDLPSELASHVGVDRKGGVSSTQALAPAVLAKGDPKQTDVIVKKPVSVKLVFPRVSFMPRRINTRKDLFHWLTEGAINDLFVWATFDNDYISGDGDSPHYLSLYKRYFLVPSKCSLLLELRLRTTDALTLPIFAKMEPYVDEKVVRAVVLPTDQSLGIKQLFGEASVDFPDAVERVVLELLMVDSLNQSKLYRGNVTFDIRDSGVVVPYVKFRSILGIHLSSTYFNWIFTVVSVASFLLFISLSSWFVFDCKLFVHRYTQRHRNFSRRSYGEGVMVFFLNNYLRLVDVLIIFLIGSMCALYLTIQINTNAVYDHLRNLSTLDGRLQLNDALTKVRMCHKSLWATLSLLLFMVLLREVKLFQWMISVVYTCVKSAFTLYLLVAVAMVLLIATFLFFMFVFASEHFNGMFLLSVYDSSVAELSRGEGSLLNSTRLLFNEVYIRPHLYESTPLSMLIYPICLIVKSWILNVIFSYLWAIWPKNDKEPDREVMEKTEDMFKDDDIKPYTLPNDCVNLTKISDDQLDLITDDVKALCTDEALHLNALFEEYNKQFTESGMTSLDFLESLHEKLVGEMSEVLFACEKTQLSLEVLHKKCAILEKNVDRNLETNISLVEVALSDKKDELSAAFATYKSLIDEENAP